MNATTSVQTPRDPSVPARYHHRTKHHFHRYAASLGYLDWETQPDPFRVYRGAPRTPLMLAADRVAAPFARLYQPGAIPPAPVTLESISVLFELALGLSAWKEHQGARWALRCNPSSGNLHPTEGYLLLARAANTLSPGVYHYVSRDHALELRCSLNATLAERLAGAMPQGAFAVGLSSIHWREAWKYGERAYRYCQHDAGHAVAAVRYAAAALGWTARLADGLADADVAALLGLDRAADFAGIDRLDREHPDALLVIAPAPGLAAAAVSEALESRIDDAVAAVRAGSWAGEANALSPSHVQWEEIDAAAKACEKPRTPSASRATPSCFDVHRMTDEAGGPNAILPAATIIRRRRSAVDFDGRTSIPVAAFYAVLDRLLPRADVPPWDALPWAPRVHAAIFAHRVDGLAPGLYLFERAASVHDEIAPLIRPDAAWTRPSNCPDHLRLFLLKEADCRAAAREISCQQEIAADGAFSLGMIARFAPSLAEGAWWYRRLFWEAGVLGHALYLEAETWGVRGTGIGCYFDDAMHEILGLADDRYQSVYHFTVGGPVKDTRLRTLPPYDHLNPPRGS
ncbi:MAG: SagB/ThcOx family dehydrogenase [Planctomycetes bacterium]|nr:SagB/ThcOx family dehydrogenase [Planctomycetota bacterium]